VSDVKIMGDYKIPEWQKFLSWIAALAIISLNIKMVYNEITDLLINGSQPVLVSFTLVPVCIFCFTMLIYILLQPFIMKRFKKTEKSFHSNFRPLLLTELSPSKRIAITVDFSHSDNKAINKALQMGNKTSTFILIHVLESTGAVVYGDNTHDLERDEDASRLHEYQKLLQQAGFEVEIQLGFGDAKKAIPKLVRDLNCDTLVMGTHGHRTLKDLLFGSTINSIRHEIKIPMVLV